MATTRKRTGAPRAPAGASTRPARERVSPPPIAAPEPSSRSSLFDSSRRGRPVVRPGDLLALRVELVNMTVTPGKGGEPPQMAHGGSGNAFLVLHFPPQSIAEQVFIERAAKGVTLADVPTGAVDKPAIPPGDHDVDPPPVRARIAGESRLAFKVPAGFQAPYTLAGVLQACESLTPNVPANALPRQRGLTPRPPIGLPVKDLAKLSASQRVQLGHLALRTMQLARREGVASSTLAARAVQGAVGVGPVVTAPPVLGAANPPRPAAPGATQTSIELPWRLILSPHTGERFRHASQPVTSPVTQRTELWHSRLIAAPDADGHVIEPPRPDPDRTVRAVWALTGERSDPAHPMSADFPTTGTLPRTEPPTTPFLATLDDFDRFQITHLSSNFSHANYDPDPLDVNLLMLSSLGGWLDSKGAWNPVGLSVEEWVHRGSMGRDHYVRVVYKGFLYPFGHRVALVKVSERKFHNGTNNTSPEDGNPAYLRQRLFIVVRERERTYVDPGLFSLDGKRSFQRQFPFNSIRILTAVTPNLDAPTDAACRFLAEGHGQNMFWPCVNKRPFQFRCVGTDIDGRKAQFELPLIFMDGSRASPRKAQGSGANRKLVPDYPAAEGYAKIATDEWLARAGEDRPRRQALFNRQRIALAPSVKSGDTAAEVEDISFGGEWQAGSNGLRTYSNGLQRPIFYPSVTGTHVRIAAMTQLTGSGQGNNELVWSPAYLQHGFDAPDTPQAQRKNVGQVFAEIKPSSGMAQLDFSSQGDRSGGFVMPNLKPSGLSRSLGPVSGPLDQIVGGTPVAGTDMFPTSLSDLPLPLLFGCIPLGAILQAMAGGGDKMPKFASEAADKLESFFNALARAHGFVQQIGAQSGSLAQAAVDVVKGMVDDLLDQALALAAAQAAPIKAALVQVKAGLDAVRQKFDSLVAPQGDGGLPSIDQVAAALQGANATQLIDAIDEAIDRLDTLRGLVKGAPLPAGFQQSVLSAIQQGTTFLGDFKAIIGIVTAAKALFDALKLVVEDPAALTEPAEVEARLEGIRTAIPPLRDGLAGFRLLDGAPRKTVLAALDGVSDVLGFAEPIASILESLFGDELVVRFDWKPAIDNFALPGADKETEPIFRANDKHGFVVAVEARMKKSGGSPKVGVVCSLKHFDLVLINPAAFMELNFEKIEFSIDSSAKMNIDVLLTDIKFVGPLSFVETLKDLIPLDGFSDPPYLDISPSGIDAGFNIGLPSIAVGMFSLSNLSLGAGVTVPFIGQPLAVRFNFCTREQPFNLTVSLFGGGGFFGVTIDPHGVQLLEAAFEFGASVSINLGVASGGVSVMAGVYFRMEKDAASLTGYFRLAGYVSVLGIISASLELYLELRYEFETGKCVGKAQLTIEISIFCFSKSVTITCERKFAGSNGDPTFRQLMGLDPGLSLTDELNQIQPDTDYAWREYVEAFA